MPRWLIVVLAVAAAVVVIPFVLFASGDEEADGEPAPRVARVIDEQRGTYRGVGIGDSADDVRGRLGYREFADLSEGSSPLGESFSEIGGPMVIDFPPRGPSSSRDPSVLRYPNASFLLLDGKVFAFTVTEEGTATRRGLAIGHDLESAAELYDGLRCGDAEPESGPYPYCAGAVGRQRHLWLGQDPIRSITIATTAFDGYER